MALEAADSSLSPRRCSVKPWASMLSIRVPPYLFRSNLGVLLVNLPVFKRAPKALINSSGSCVQKAYCLSCQDPIGIVALSLRIPLAF